MSELDADGKLKITKKFKVTMGMDEKGNILCYHPHHSERHARAWAILPIMDGVPNGYTHEHIAMCPDCFLATEADRIAKRLPMEGAYVDQPYMTATDYGSAVDRQNEARENTGELPGEITEEMPAPPLEPAVVSLVPKINEGVDGKGSEDETAVISIAPPPPQISSHKPSPAARRGRR